MAFQPPKINAWRTFWEELHLPNCWHLSYDSTTETRVSLNSKLNLNNPTSFLGSLWKRFRFIWQDHAGMLWKTPFAPFFARSNVSNIFPKFPQAIPENLKLCDMWDLQRRTQREQNLKLCDTWDLPDLQRLSTSLSVHPRYRPPMIALGI